MMLERLAETCGGPAVEEIVKQDFRPHRHPDRAFGNEARGRWGRHDTRTLRTATPLVVTLPLDTTHMRLDLDFNDGGCFGGRKRAERCPTACAAFLRCAQVADFDDDRQGGTVTAAVPRTAGLLSPLTRADLWRDTSLIEVRRFFAFRPVQTLGEVADRGLMGFDCCLQCCFPLHQLLVLRPPVVRLPGELDIGLFRQYHGLLGKRCHTLPVDQCKRRGGYSL